MIKLFAENIIQLIERKIIFLFVLLCPLFSLAQNNQKEQRDKFYLLCLDDARQTMNEGPARQYCLCYVDFVFDKIAETKKIPSDSLLKNQADTCRDNAIKVYGNLTFHQVWDENKKKEYLNACEKNLKGSSINPTYCSCSLEKLMILYPDPQKILTMTEDEMNKISSECLSQE